MLNGARKNLSNHLSNFVTYLWVTTLEVFGKSRVNAEGSSYKMDTNAIKKIAVFGPGMMGHAIAQEFAQAGYTETLRG
jgi:hypothetical protein